MSDDLDVSRRLLEVAIQAAREAGEAVVEPFRRGVSAVQKAGNYDLVTEYDRMAERMIAARVFAAFPDSTLVGEEGGSQGNGAVRWYVDPIDGTNNFADGLPFFCVSVGAALRGRMLAGAIYDPLRRELFAASLDGAFLNGDPIHCHGHPDDASAVVISGCPSSGRRAGDDEYALFRRLVDTCHSVRRMGCTALELAYVACGRADVSYGLRTNPWDVAAASLLVRQAGGRYLGMRTRETSADLRPWECGAFIGCCPEFRLEGSIIAEVAARGPVVAW